MARRKIELQSGYVLHRREYRNTSLIMDFFTLDHGRVSLVAKGVRRPGYKMRGYLQAFQPLYLSWVQGNSQLGTLCQVEPRATAFDITGKALFNGLYLNELLMKLTVHGDPHEQVFQHYEDTLAGLGERRAAEPLLRVFEHKLLLEMGYGLQLDRDVHGQPVVAQRRYCYLVEQGPLPVEMANPAGCPVLGQAMLDLHRGHLRESSLPEIKRLMRYVLQHYLGHKQIQSRVLFQTV